MILVAACGTAPTNPPGSTATSTPATTASPGPTASPTPTSSPPATPTPSVSPSLSSSEPLATLTLQPRPPVLTSLAFADATHGWLGSAGAILATADGGGTWHKAWSGAGTVLELAALDRRHAWAVVAHVATDGTLSAPELLGTTNGGVRWNATKLVHRVAALDFVSPSVGWAIEIGSTDGSANFGGGPQGRLLHTTDGGRTWTDGGAGIATAACFLDGRRGWATGGSTIRRTVDGGRTWRVVAKRPNAAFAFDSALTCKGGSLWLFQDIPNGAGGHVNYAGLRSTDGGRTWRHILANAFFEDTPTTIGHADDEPGPFTAPGAATGIELGVSPAAEEASVTVTRDGGRTWHRTTLEGLTSAGPITFPDSRHGFVLGSNTGQQDVLLATADGGRTWSERWPTTTPAPTSAISFVSSTTGFGIGIPGDGRAVLASVDSGGSWTQVGQLPEAVEPWRSDPAELSFADSANGWLVSAAGNLLATADGGRTWRRVAIPKVSGTMHEVVFADALHGCALTMATDVGQTSTEIATTDGGATWTTVAGAILPVAACAHGDVGRTIAAAAAGRVSQLVPTLDVLDDRTAWVLTDQGLDRTTDGGATWSGVAWPSPQTSDGAEAFSVPVEVTFVSPSDGWFLGGGAVFRTADGGASWTELPVAMPAAACMSNQLEVTSVAPAGGLGTVSAWLRFTNASDRRCSLRGWPTLVGVTGTGATSIARRSNVPLTLPVDVGPQAVALGPGDSAFAEYEGSDNPTGTATTCPSYRTLRVTAPGTHHAVTISAWNAWLGQDLPACAGIKVTMVVSLASVSHLANGPTAGTPPPALSVDRPALSVSPSSHLRNGQAVAVRVTGLGVGGKVFLSECAAAAVASDLGCGAQLAAQPFLVTDDSRVGHATFIVSASSSADPFGTAALRPCADRCVIVATLGDGYPFVVAPISFFGNLTPVRSTDQIFVPGGGAVTGAKVATPQDPICPNNEPCGP
jgi:photosystem II stability/assembly factor-like uncharacterized protein